MDAYLNTAEQVLFAARRPLRPREILRDAYVTGLVPWHLHGKRQDRTLHARLSEDILVAANDTCQSVSQSNRVLSKSTTSAVTFVVIRGFP